MTDNPHSGLIIHEHCNKHSAQYLILSTFATCPPWDDSATELARKYPPCLADEELHPGYDPREWGPEDWHLPRPLLFTRSLLMATWSLIAHPLQPCSPKDLDIRVTSRLIISIANRLDGLPVDSPENISFYLGDISEIVNTYLFGSFLDDFPNPQQLTWASLIDKVYTRACIVLKPGLGTSWSPPLHLNLSKEKSQMLKALIETHTQSIEPINFNYSIPGDRVGETGNGSSNGE